MKLDLEFREGLSSVLGPFLCRCAGVCERILLGLEEENSPVSSLELENIGLLLIVHSLDGESVMHADGVLQIVF